jgi:hypothetical protein
MRDTEESKKIMVQRTRAFQGEARGFLRCWDHW